MGLHREEVGVEVDQGDQDTAHHKEECEIVHRMEMEEELDPQEDLIEEDLKEKIDLAEVVTEEVVVDAAMEVEIVILITNVWTEVLPEKDHVVEIEVNDSMIVMDHQNADHPEVIDDHRLGIDHEVENVNAVIGETVSVMIDAVALVVVVVDQGDSKTLLLCLYGHFVNQIPWTDSCCALTLSPIDISIHVVT